MLVRLSSEMEASCSPWRRGVMWKLAPGPPKRLQNTQKQVRALILSTLTSINALSVQYSWADLKWQVNVSCILLPSTRCCLNFLADPQVLINCHSRIWLPSVLFSATAAQGVPESRGRRYADLHILCQWWQTGEQGQQPWLHSKFKGMLTLCPCQCGIDGNTWIYCEVLNFRCIKY